MTSTLYFAFAPGCSHCAAARPAVEAFQKKHAADAMVLKLNVSATDWQPAGWRSEGTPAYAVQVGAHLVAEHEGVLSLEELEQFHADALAHAAEAAPVPGAHAA